MRWQSEPGSALAKARMRAHRLMDTYTFDGRVTRAEIYKALANEMGIHLMACHFGSFRLSQVTTAIEILEKLLPAMFSSAPAPDLETMLFIPQIEEKRAP